MHPVLKDWLSQANGVPFPDVNDWARLNGRDAIKEHLGDAFLLLRKSLVTAKVRSTVFSTVSALMKKKTEKELPLADARVFFVHPSGRSAFPDFISVGRMANNDIVLDDPSITKFHAFFRMENGKLTLCDAKSSNGTTANGQKVPHKGEGSIEPKNKMVLRFGEVELLFLTADGLANFAAQGID